MFHRDGPELMNNMHSRKNQSKDLVVYPIMSGKSCISIESFDNNSIEKMIFSKQIENIACKSKLLHKQKEKPEENCNTSSTTKSQDIGCSFLSANNFLKKIEFNFEQSYVQ